MHLKQWLVHTKVFFSSLCMIISTCSFQRLSTTKQVNSKILFDVWFIWKWVIIYQMRLLRSHFPLPLTIVNCNDEQLGCCRIRFAHSEGPNFQLVCTTVSPRIGRKYIQKICHPIWNCTIGDYWIVVTNPKLLKNRPIARNLS